MPVCVFFRYIVFFVSKLNCDQVYEGSFINDVTLITVKCFDTTFVCLPCSTSVFFNLGSAGPRGSASSLRSWKTLLYVDQCFSTFFNYWMNQDWVQESILAWLWHPFHLALDGIEPRTFRLWAECSTAR